ncbi:organic solute transporter Ostalpha-domain-containing protein [Mycena maculata]|uniref:Organic solute transporter Ostalpha-domain-containing protein n=1 Tax=Mycena maculata TaxID=230809 RepID=A0AAD7HXU3_9AGAR|nr:organic solute transporter Ostalpha-domain-containing protein [Mycena maculata]
MSNSTCPVETSPSSPSLFQNGNLVFQAHHVGWIVAGFFTIISVITSFWLVNKHLQWYTNKREQRYIVRLLFMVPIYATISLASYLFWNHSTPLLLIRDGYESTVLTAFFYLLLVYLSPNPDEQKAIFLKVGLSRAADAAALANGEKPKKWMLPLGFVKAKPADGLYFLQMMKWGVLQYCVIRPLTTLIAVVLNYAGWYCDSSFSPRWGYVYITVIVSISVTVAMYCLIQVYIPIAPYLASQKPLLKLFSIKAVVFLTFWQATFLSCLSMFGVVKDTTYMTADDINIGIAALLETFEMMCFAFLHLRAFSYKPYRPFHDPKSKAPPPTPTPRLRSLGHVLDFRETFREIHAGWIYILDKMRGREPTPDIGARRIAHYESAFGRPRPSNLPTSKGVGETGDAEKGLLSSSGVPREIVDEMPSWLGPLSRREKSESLEVQIQRELERRGYESNIPGRGHIGPAHDTDAPGHKPQRSWWRSVYSRVSQSGPDPEDERRLTPQASKRKKSKSRTPGSLDIDANRRLLVEYDYNFEDPPPEPVLNSHRSRRHDRHHAPQEEHLDTLAPLSVFTAHRSSHQVRPQKQRSSSNPTSSRPTPPPDPGPPMSQSQPLLGLSMQPPFSRSDSLLGRVFPTSASNASSADHPHGSDSGGSLPSVSTHGVPPSRATIRGRLILTTPQMLGKVAPTERRSTLNCPAEYLTPAPQQAPLALSVEAFHSNGTEHGVQVDERQARYSHIREFADHLMPDQRPVLTLNTMPDGLLTSPLSADFVEHGVGGAAPPSQPRTSSQNSTRHGDLPPQSSGLRRASAQIYSPDSPSRRSRRQSVDVNAPQMPESSYTRPASSFRPSGQSNRRMSAPVNPVPHSQYSIPIYQEEELRRSGYSVENMRSDITQPSLSGTPNAYKYPTVMPSGRTPPPTENSLRLLGLPPPPSPTQLSHQRDPYFSTAGPSAPPGVDTRRARRPHGGKTSRSKDYKKPTTRP